MTGTDRDNPLMWKRTDSAALATAAAAVWHGHQLTVSLVVAVSLFSTGAFKGKEDSGQIKGAKNDVYVSPSQVAFCGIQAVAAASVAALAEDFWQMIPCRRSSSKAAALEDYVLAFVRLLSFLVAPKSNIVVASIFTLVRVIHVIRLGYVSLDGMDTDRNAYKATVSTECASVTPRVDVDVAIGKVKVELEKPARFPVFVRTFSCSRTLQVSSSVLISELAHLISQETAVSESSFYLTFQGVLLHGDVSIERTGGGSGRLSGHERTSQRRC